VNKCMPLVLVVLTCSACRQDMQQQPKFPPLARSWFYPDGRSARPVPAGTIAVDEISDNSALTTGYANGALVTTIPIPITASMLQRGRDRYNIYCAPCHAETGDGDGMIARRGFKHPANLNGDRVKNAPPGYIYAVISNGYGGMADYAYQIKDPSDRWAIVAYIRALELSQGAALSDLNTQEQSLLEAMR
jgi:mono/diheme cytochrome c family protein